MSTCQAGGAIGQECGKPARMAVKTRRTRNDDVVSDVYYDDQEAPAKALRYCKACGVNLVTQLAKALVAPDQEV